MFDDFQIVSSDTNDRESRTQNWERMTSTASRNPQLDETSRVSLFSKTGSRYQSSEYFWRIVTFDMDTMRSKTLRQKSHDDKKIERNSWNYSLIYGLRHGDLWDYIYEGNYVKVKSGLSDEAIDRTRWWRARALFKKDKDHSNGRNDGWTLREQHDILMRERDSFMRVVSECTETNSRDYRVWRDEIFDLWCQDFYV